MILVSIVEFTPERKKCARTVRFAPLRRHPLGEAVPAVFPGVIPAKAGIYVSQKTTVSQIHTMGPRLRGDDASAGLPAACELQLPGLA